MGKFQQYARELNDVAQKNFAAYRKAETAYNEAQAAAKGIPQGRSSYPTDQMIALQRAKEAQTELYHAKYALINSVDQIPPIRRRLVAALEEAYTADPKALDTQTVELMRSGVLKASEYAALMRKASSEDNYLMARIIGKYAMEQAEERAKSYGTTDPEAVALRGVSYTGKDDPKEKYIKAFDDMAGVYRICTGNPAMIDTWDHYTEATREAF